jgi:hypothetical protein
MQAMRDHSGWVEQRRAELIAQRMAALQPN